MLTILLQFALSVLLYALVLGVSVFVHEAGHFLVSAWTNVATEAFYVGVPCPYPSFRREEDRIVFGVRLYKKRVGTWKGTPMYLGPLPLGGFVKPIADETDPRSFQQAPPWKKTLILIAGPLMNILLAGVIVFIIQGIEHPDMPVLPYVLSSFGRLGRNLVFYTVGTLDALVHLFSGDLMGPVGIFQVVKEETTLSVGTGDWTNFLSLLGALNLSLAIGNMLPIGALDGAKLVMAAVEWIAKRRIIWLERAFTISGAVALVAIFIIITIGDIGRLFR